MRAERRSGGVADESVGRSLRPTSAAPRPAETATPPRPPPALGGGARRRRARRPPRPAWPPTSDPRGGAPTKRSTGVGNPGHGTAGPGIQGLSPMAWATRRPGSMRNDRSPVRRRAATSAAKLGTHGHWRPRPRRRRRRTAGGKRHRRADDHQVQVHRRQQIRVGKRADTAVDIAPAPDGNRLEVARHRGRMPPPPGRRDRQGSLGGRTRPELPSRRPTAHNQSGSDGHPPA